MPPEGNTPPAGQGGAPAQPASGGQAPGNPVIDEDRLVTKVAEKVLAGLQPVLTKGTNARAAAARVAAKAGQEGDGDEGSEGDDLADLESKSKSELLEIVKRTRATNGEFTRRLKHLEEKDTQRVAEEQKRSIESALDKELKNGGYANADLLSLAVRPNLKIDDKGAIWFDDGKTAKPLADAVKEFGQRPQFRPAPAGEGTNTQSGTAPTQTGGAQQPVDVMKMTSEEFAQYKAKLKSQAT